MTSEPDPIVHIVDDDREVRDSVRFLVESVGLAARCYDCADTFLRDWHDTGPGVVLLDLRMPGASGLETLETLPARNIHAPVIVMTGHGDVQAAVRALKLGAVDFLEKPCNDNLLIETLRHAIAADVKRRREREKLQSIASAAASLTDRESDVLELLIAGKSNKEAARVLGLSPKTVERHRARIMRKFRVDSFARLVGDITLIRQRMDVMKPVGGHDGRGGNGTTGP